MYICSRRDMVAVECLTFHSYHVATWTYIYKNILTDQYNGFVTLKDFELPDDGFNWGAETCWSDWSIINYPELICAFCWFIFISSYWKCTVQKTKKRNSSSLFYCADRNLWGDGLHIHGVLISLQVLPEADSLSFGQQALFHEVYKEAR